jgi:hypothetical protein
MKMREARVATYGGLLLLACSSAAAPFGTDDDRAYAAKLWQRMVEHYLVGEQAFYSTPYRGAFPHGDYLDTIDAHLLVGERRGRLLVQRNYVAEGLGKAMVANDPPRYLAAITVMYQREAGYDKAHGDWFWVKYAPGGEGVKADNGMSLAGRVARGSWEGCIACHAAAAVGMLFRAPLTMIDAGSKGLQSHGYFLIVASRAIRPGGSSCCRSHSSVAFQLRVVCAEGCRLKP